MSSGVLSGDFDVAVQRLPVYNPRLVTSEWIREPPTLYLPAAHPLASVGGEAEGVVARPLAGATTKLYVVCRSGEPDPLLTKFWSVLRGTSRTPEAASDGPRT